MGPTSVVIATDVKAGLDLVDDGGTLNVGKVDIVAHGILNTTGDTSNFVSFLPDTPSPGAGDLWAGLYVNFGNRSQIDYADIGYAQTSVNIQYGADSTRVTNSKLHHFQNQAIFALSIPGASMLLEDNSIYRDAAGAGLFGLDGNSGIVLQKCDEVSVLGNTITLAGMDNEIGGAAIYIQNVKSFCDNEPSSVESLLIVDNTLVGPGGDPVADGEWQGIDVDWACGSSNRKYLFSGNRITHWNGAAFDILQSSDLQVSCNSVDSSAVAVDFERNSSGGTAPVRLRENALVIDDYSGGTNVVIRTDDALKLKLGPSVLNKKGKNRIISRALSKYVEENDGGATDSLDARVNRWLRNGILHTTADSIHAYVHHDSTLTADSARVKVGSPMTTNPTFCAPGAQAFVALGEELDRERETGAELGVTLVAEIGGDLVTELAPPRPNPFGSTTRIQFVLATADPQRVQVDVFDVSGRRVRRLVDGFVESGVYDVIWSGRDSAGSRVSSGIFFVRMSTDGFTQVRRLVVLR